MSNQSYEHMLQSHLAGQDVGVQGLTRDNHQANLAALLPVLTRRAGGHLGLWIGPQTLAAVNTHALQQHTGLSIQVREGSGGWMILEAKRTAAITGAAHAPPNQSRAGVASGPAQASQHPGASMRPGSAPAGVSRAPSSAPSPVMAQPGVSQAPSSAPSSVVSQPGLPQASVAQLDPGVSVSSLPGAPQPVPAMSTVNQQPSAKRGFGARIKNLRWRWIPVGALVMGAVAVAATYLLFNTSALDSVGGPSTQLRVMFGIACLGYLFGGFIIAILSPGKTIAEPLIAAVMAYAAQLGFIFSEFLDDFTFLSIPTILVVAVLNGLFAYGGSWIGEQVTHKS